MWRPESRTRNLEFEQERSGWKSRVTISLLVTDDAGKELIKTGETMTFHETIRPGSRVPSPTRPSSSSSAFRRARTGSRTESKTCRRRRSAWSELRKGAHKNAAVQHMRLVLPEMPTDLPSFSDALFVWDVDPRASGIRKYRPNPSHMYGLYRDSLTVYVELYIPEDETPAPTLEFHSEIATQKGDPVRDTQIALANPDAGSTRSRTYPVVIHEDLSALEAGAYTLFLSFGLDGQSLTRIKAGDFSVAWDMRTWEIPRREYLAEARFLLGDDDFKKFQSLNPGQQEKMLDDRWKQYDPDPTTGTNEAYNTFLERLDYINAHYGDEGLAIFTDRGDIYMRYGPPDEFVQDVIPLNYDTLAEAEAVVDNPYHPLNLEFEQQQALFGAGDEEHVRVE